MNKTLFVFSAFLFCAGCVGAPSLKNDMLDSRSLVPQAPSFTLPDLRLGGIRYTRDRFIEREAVAWHFDTRRKFHRGVPREDLEEYQSVKARIYEVGVVESGRHSGRVLERWDVIDETVAAEGAPKVFRYHHYFLRNETNLVYLPAMTKGAQAKNLWSKNAQGQEIISFLRQKWEIGVSEDKKFRVPELLAESAFTIPGEGVYEATPTGEAITVTESRLGAPVPLASLPKGRELYRVPGDWVVCMYPDGLAVHLRKK